MIMAMLVMMAQFKAGDLVYLKNDPTQGWITSQLASVRYRPSYGQSLGSASSVAAANAGAGTDTAVTVFWPKYTKGKVQTTVKPNGDTIVRILQEDWKESYWFHADDLAAWTEEIDRKKADDREYQIRLGRMKILSDKIMPYAVTKSEIAALNSAINKGLDPTAMTAKEASQLTAGERRAISSVRRRFKQGLKP